jgi:hypothetical protein
VGFFVANASLLATVRFGVLPVLDAITSPPWLRSAIGVLSGLTIVLGPFIVSAVSVGVGSLAGIFFAFRSIRGSKGA